MNNYDFQKFCIKYELCTSCDIRQFKILKDLCLKLNKHNIREFSAMLWIVSKTRYSINDLTDMLCILNGIDR